MNEREKILILFRALSEEDQERFLSFLDRLIDRPEPTAPEEGLTG